MRAFNRQCLLSLLALAFSVPTLQAEDRRDFFETRRTSRSIWLIVARYRTKSYDHTFTACHRVVMVSVLAVVRCRLAEFADVDIVVMV
jgi:hypothetical protein